jgi:AcrR family transcriptional regulator
LIVKQAKTALCGAGHSSSGKSARDRIIGAAFSAFMESGYGGASTLEIATRAKVSKRELYTLFDNKHAMLVVCIAERANRMRLPLKLPTADNREALVATLNAFGIAILRGVCDPNVLAVYRLAIAEADNSPEIAGMLDKAGREANRAALVELLTAAQANGLFSAVKPATVAAHFFALIWGDLLVRLLLRVTKVPSAKQMEQRVHAATEILMTLYPEPISEKSR